MEDAACHCAKGTGMWEWASNDQGDEPDVVITSAGGVATTESLAATALLRQKFPNLKIGFVNVVDLFRLVPQNEHPHGLSDRDFRQCLHDRQADYLQFPWLSVAGSQADLPADQSR
jgi:xylulose-5-phosphate/fructose-6-phosphate phosphoketolase